jgi:hypothetical protein
MSEGRQTHLGLRRPRLHPCRGSHAPDLFRPTMENRGAPATVRAPGTIIASPARAVAQPHRSADASRSPPRRNPRRTRPCAGLTDHGYPCRIALKPLQEAAYEECGRPAGTGCGRWVLRWPTGHGVPSGTAREVRAMCNNEGAKAGTAWWIQDVCPRIPRPRPPRNHRRRLPRSRTKQVAEILETLKIMGQG